MILVDTSIWIDHLRKADPELVGLLTRNEVLTHPFVTGEIALGSVARRDEVLRYLGNLPVALMATHDEVMTLVARHSLASSGLGYVDAALLASTALTRGASIWTRDKALHAAAIKIGVAARL